MIKPLRALARRMLRSAGYCLTPIVRSPQLPSGALLAQGVDAHGTHFIPLAAAVARTNGPVLELGMGDHSTPLLHLLCHNRLLVSADSSARWVSRYEAFRSATHELHAVPDWNRWRMPEQREWAVAFLDCSPAAQRVDLLVRLRGRARFIVIHDTDPDVDSTTVFAFEAELRRFRYRSDYRVLRPFTTVVSDVEPFAMTEAERIPLA